MSTTTITGTIHGVNNAALANKWISFRLVQLGTDAEQSTVVAQSVDSIQTDTNGDFTIGIWNNGDSGKTSVLEIAIQGSKAEYVIIPTGVATIELWDLIENYQADGSTSGQVPVVSALFVRKASNLSDLESATTARINLGLGSAATTESSAYATAAQGVLATNAIPTSGIGSTVQAHSAILSATTASFTTTKETAISTNTADIASNNTDIGVLTGAVVQNETDIATNVTNIALKSPIDNPTFTGTVTAPLIDAGSIDFNPGAAGGELSWNNTEKTLNLVTGSDNVTIQVGQEVVLYCRNTSGLPMADGQVVKVVGSQGNNPTIALAQADTVENARGVIGVVTQFIQNQSNGFVSLIGKVRDLTLDGGTYTEGDLLYLSSTVAGGLTKVRPDIGVAIGRVIATSNGGNNAGVLEVSIDSEVAVHELEQDVIANTAAIAALAVRVTALENP